MTERRGDAAGAGLRWAHGIVGSISATNAVELWDTTSGRRVEVAALDAIPEAATRTGIDALPAATVSGLIDRGFLVRSADELAPASARPRSAVGPPGLLGMPSVPFADVVTGRVRPDVAVLGVPFDGGVGSMPGARHGPEIARRYTIGGLSFDSDLAVCDTYDAALRTPVLPGRVLVDVGDVCPLPADPRVPRTDVYDAIEHAVRRLSAACGIPVVVGGDHSVTAAAVRGLGKAARPFRVVVFDAHCDYQRTDTTGYGSVHHANFLAHVLDCAHVSAVDVVGVREFVGPEAWPLPDRLRCGGTDLPVPMDDEEPVYVSVDLDVVDPTLFDATGHPSPGGVTVTALLTAVRKVVAARTLVGLDVVEPLPDDRQNASTGMLVSRLVLDALRANLEPAAGP